MTPRWQVFALRAAQREAACRRYHRRIHGKLIRNYGSYLRQQKRLAHIDRDYHRLRLISVVEAAKAGVEAEQWQDLYYREIERFGEGAPTDVASRFRLQDARLTAKDLAA